MKLFRVTLSAIPRDSELVRQFGQAWLVSARSGSGQCRLIGGSRADRATAREWVSLFGHEALVDTRPEAPSRVATPSRVGHRIGAAR